MPRIGKPSRIGRIGKPGKRRGPIGKATGTYGSSQHTDLTRVKADYPTTTT